ncbi:MAG: TlyA family RNA methyltransferase [Candidatus Sumerlaeaceae bacterium]|nr:TlyA family RNA methyltransferase [Candidatus Sumerlaeaceae bacterium]
MNSPPPRRPGGARRLDLEMVARGLADTREQAQRLILAGLVSVAGTTRVKPGMKTPPDAVIEVAAPERYVSRGGLKLEAALAAFALDPAGRVCADIGASTGGFTDCLLQHGAARVYAVDVGRSQLHPRLRADTRVVLIEQCNARNLAADTLPEPVDLIVVDVSFISVTKILPALSVIAQPQAHAVVLVKPQFEATPAEVSRGRGVIRDESLRGRALRAAVAAALAAQWRPLRAIPCPVQGTSGNREWLLLLKRQSDVQAMDADALVREITAPDPSRAGHSGLDIDGLPSPACNDTVKDNSNPEKPAAPPGQPQ